MLGNGTKSGYHVLYSSFLKFLKKIAFFFAYDIFLFLKWLSNIESYGLILHIFNFFPHCPYLYCFNFLSSSILYFKFIYWNFILILMFLIPKSSSCLNFSYFSFCFRDAIYSFISFRIIIDSFLDMFFCLWNSSFPLSSLSFGFLILEVFLNLCRSKALNKLTQHCLSLWELSS